MNKFLSFVASSLVIGIIMYLVIDGLIQPKPIAKIEPPEISPQQDIAENIDQIISSAIKPSFHQVREVSRFRPNQNTTLYGVVFEWKGDDLPPWAREHQKWAQAARIENDSVLVYWRAPVSDTVQVGQIVKMVTTKKTKTISQSTQVDLPTAGLIALTHLELNGDSLYIKGSQLPVNQYVEFGVDPEQNDQWQFSEYAWQNESEQILVRFTSRKLENSQIEHKGHRDLGDFLVAWIAVDPQSYLISHIYLAKQELIWLE